MGFNRFRNDKFSPDSIELLKDAGINFNNLFEYGIESLVFAEGLISSGMVINPDIKWITFHGAFDFAYLVKSLTNEILPPTLEQFQYKCKQFFPAMYDTKIIAAEMDDIKGNSLQKLANELCVRTILSNQNLTQLGQKSRIPASSRFRRAADPPVLPRVVSQVP